MENVCPSDERKYNDWVFYLRCDRKTEIDDVKEAVTALTAA